MKPHIIEYGKVAPDAPITDRFEVGVTLDLRLEYHIVLPALRKYLRELLASTREVPGDDEDRDENAPTPEQVAARIEEVKQFQRGLAEVELDTSRFFNLTDAEVGGAASILTREGHNPRLSVGEGVRRFDLAVQLTSCLGQAWAELSAPDALPIQDPRD